MAATTFGQYESQEKRIALVRAAKWGLLPAIVLLVLVAFAHDLRLASRTLWQRYLAWVRGQ